ncbi:MAG TPA: beta-ketoacyl synthase N-terminal-like domain-containing protein, partial [Nannocystis sp.]
MQRSLHIPAFFADDPALSALGIRASSRLWSAATGEPGSVDSARWISAWIAHVLQIDVAGIDPQARPFDLGLASIHGVQLAAALAVKLGRPVSPTLLWEHATIAELAAHLDGAPPLVPASPLPHAGVRGPVAIVGMAGRFPKARDLDAFWELLADGVDATGRVPADRWPADRWHDPDPHSPGKSVTDRGAFLDDVRGFEPLFFGISPREADELDPQQRLALELVWEALEDAGVPPRGLRGSRTGVYLGAMWHDWADLTHADLAGMSAHRATGTSNNLIANRVSYVLGLRGPSLVLDTACSSALVAIHLACQALADGDAELAIAGAVNLMLSPAASVFCSKFGGLAPDGRCKTFDAAADGFARGEGGGVVVLKPLARALADGDRIHAIVRGSAVNNDGASQGLTAPNPRAQEDVLRVALARAGLAGSQVHYVEAHGTGTLLGDPIEAGALGAVFAVDRPDDRPLYIGSVKTNIGHLEGAAGIAGVIKTALAMRHRAIPPSLHLHEPNPHIPFAALRLRVPTTLAAWPAPLDAPALAGVSAFGWGGTNAHVVLEAAPPAPRWIGVAAPDEASLAVHLRALASTDLAQISAMNGAGPVRAAFVARSTHELREQLAVQRSACDGLVRGSTTPRLVFVCSPLGSQWPGMARQLLAEPVFHAAILRCEQAFSPLLGRSIVDDLRGAWSGIDDVVRVQPLLFSLQVGLAALLASWGVVPAAIVGHSAGEIAAAHIAGALTLEQAAGVVHHYARVQQASAGAGAMAVVALPADALGEWLAPHAGQVVIAAHNSASSTVISGAAAAVAAIVTAIQATGVACSPIHTDVAGHSPLVAAGLGDLRDSLAALTPAATERLHSSVTGGPCDVPVDGAYWARNLGGVVRFHDAIGDLFARGHDTFVELGPHPVISHALQQIAGERGVPARILPTLRRGSDERMSLLTTRAALFVAGATGPEPAAPAHLLVLSARSEAALERTRDTIATWLATRPIDLHDLCFTAALRRSHLEHRLAVVGASREALATALQRPTRGRAGHPRIVFVFPGQGSQWFGMGRVLLATRPVFRAAFDACAAALAPHLERSPL